VTKMLTLKDILNNEGIATLDTIHLAGRDITIAQVPHVEADAKAAHTVLTRLLAISESHEVSSVVEVRTIVNG